MPAQIGRQSIALASHSHALLSARSHERFRREPINTQALETTAMIDTTIGANRPGSHRREIAQAIDIAIAAAVAPALLLRSPLYALAFSRLTQAPCG